MTIDAAILQKIEDVRSRISPEEFREVCSFLSSLPDVDSFRTEQDTMSPYEIANSILALDKPRSFPECLINGITDLLNWRLQRVTQMQ